MGHYMLVKSVNVDLEPYKGRESVNVRVEVGSQIQAQSVSPDIGSISFTFYATGAQTVSIYVDDQLVSQYTLDFGPLIAEIPR